MNQIQLNIGNIISQAWELTKKHWLILSLVNLVYFLLIYGVIVLFYPWEMLTNSMVASNINNDPMLVYAMLGKLFLGILLVSPFLYILYAGMTNIALRVTNGTDSKAQLSAFNMPLMTYVKFIVVAIIISVITSATSQICCLIPVCIFLYIRLIFAYFHIIAHPEDGIGGAFKHSWNITKGNFWNLFLLTFVGAIIALLGSLACGIGACFTYVIYIFILAIAYITLSSNNEPAPTAVTAEETATVDTPAASLPDNYQPKANSDKSEGEYNKTY